MKHLWNYKTFAINRQLVGDKRFLVSSLHPLLSSLDQNKYEETIRLSSNSIREQDERYGLLTKQQQQLSDLLETKINEVKQLTERNLQLEEDLKEHRELFFEKSKQADDLDRQLQKTINQCDDIRTTADQLRDEKTKTMNEFDRLSSQIENLSVDKAQLTQVWENCSIHS